MSDMTGTSADSGGGGGATTATATNTARQPQAAAGTSPTQNSAGQPNIGTASLGATTTAPASSTLAVLNGGDQSRTVTDMVPVGTEAPINSAELIQRMRVITETQAAQLAQLRAEADNESKKRKRLEDEAAVQEKARFEDRRKKAVAQMSSFMENIGNTAQHIPRDQLKENEKVWLDLLTSAKTNEELENASKLAGTSLYLTHAAGAHTNPRQSYLNEQREIAATAAWVTQYVNNMHGNAGTSVSGGAMNQPQSSATSTVFGSDAAAAMPSQGTVNAGKYNAFDGRTVTDVVPATAQTETKADISMDDPNWCVKVTAECVTKSLQQNAGVAVFPGTDYLKQGGTHSVTRYVASADGMSRKETVQVPRRKVTPTSKFGLKEFDPAAYAQFVSAIGAAMSPFGKRPTKEINEMRKWGEYTVTADGQQGAPKHFLKYYPDKSDTWSTN